ncbi:hypothetical protein L2E82_47917 [Cichorium intybus]|uniref:Uncharacterized protein n=1 Tax=Cichorium intybus TaxID=13427 RepID=A0ACB8YWX7_CICIN|nr:hypothetical protein L2E82_47917 [Cichorium intybus]
MGLRRVPSGRRVGARNFSPSFRFLQPIEVDYLQELKKHGVTLTEYPLLKLLDDFPLKSHARTFVSIEMHPWLVCLQKSLESFIFSEAKVKKLGQNAFCSWVRAYNAHRGELKSIFMVKKLHLGHVARSFGLKEQPSLVGRLLRNWRNDNDIDGGKKHSSATLRFASPG